MFTNFHVEQLQEIKVKKKLKALTFRSSGWELGGFPVEVENHIMFRKRYILKLIHGWNFPCFSMVIFVFRGVPVYTPNPVVRQ